MLTGKSLLSTLTDELAEMGLRSMAAALEEMYHSPNFPELDPLSAITRLIEPEYQQKMNMARWCGRWAARSSPFPRPVIPTSMLWTFPVSTAAVKTRWR